MLWLSFERQINAFRVNILGLEPLRVGEGGWNHLNVMKVGSVRTAFSICPLILFVVLHFLKFGAGIQFTIIAFLRTIFPAVVRLNVFFLCFSPNHYNCVRRSPL